MDMREALTLCALLPLVACGLSPEEFNEEYVALYCDVAVDCDASNLFFETVEDCESFVGALTSGVASYAESADDCDFNKDNASACLDDMADVTCEDLDTLSSCQAVFEGSGCG